MFIKKSIKVLKLALCITLIQAIGFNSVYAARTSTTSTKGTTTTTSITNIKDFGAHSITETGYATFDSSIAINKAIQSAKNNHSTVVNFGSGRYIAKDIDLESNITYSSSEGAELIASPSIQVWHSVLNVYNKTNITIKGLTVNGNKDLVPGDDMSGSELIGIYGSNYITITNCYLYNNWYLGVLLQDNCNYITITNNKIYDTDCGVITTGTASNNILIDSNIIYGNKNQMSEPIAIFNENTNGLAHNITITNNILHDKLNASGILVMNATAVLVKANTIYNCNQGITIGLSQAIPDSKLTESNAITVTGNTIYNCQGGVLAEANNSLISNNVIHDINRVGIWVTSLNGRGFSSSDTVINNKITNVNSVGEQEPAIRLEYSSKCTVDNNVVADTRTSVLHYFVIQVTSTTSNYNIIQNNINLGATAKGGYAIYIQGSKNTTIKNNVGTILDQGIATVATSNK